MRAQSLVWYSVEEDGMPTEKSIRKTKNRFLCIVKSLYFGKEEYTEKHVAFGSVERGQFLDSYGSKMNRSYEHTYISRVTEWAEMPQVD